MKTNKVNEPPRLGRAVLILVALVGAGCGGSEEPAPSSGSPEADQRADARVRSDEGNGTKDAATLYDRLGGEATLVALVNDLAQRTIADPRVNFERRGVRTNWVGSKYTPWEPTPDNLDRFKRHMIEFLTLATGGPASYTGRDIAAVHKGMRISNNEFDAMVGDIKTSMDRLGIARREERDLLAVIETTRKQIVEKQ